MKGNRVIFRKGKNMAGETAYCVKCRKVVTVKDVQIVAKNGRNMQKGKCSVCGTNTCKILGKTK
jgi:hypothetical protein